MAAPGQATDVKFVPVATSAESIESRCGWEGITVKIEIFEAGLEGAGILSQEHDRTETLGKENIFLRFFRQWGPLSLGSKRVGLLWLGVVCQAATVGITQPLWLVRITPPNLPTFSVPDFDFPLATLFFPVGDSGCAPPGNGSALGDPDSCGCF